MNSVFGYKTSLIVPHIVVWVLIFIVPYSALFADEDVPVFWLARLGLLNVLLITVFYVNTLWLVPKTLFKNKSKLFFLGVVVLVVFFVIAIQVLRYFFDLSGFSDAERMHDALPFPENDSRQIAFTLFPPILVIAVGTSIKLTGHWRNTQEVQNQQQKEQLKTELALLKSQINPHFFFNTLNNIYSLIELDVEKAQRGVLKLSKLMRYHLYKTNKDVVPIDSELAFIADYLDLMKLRLQDFIQVEFTESIKSRQALIPPLLLEPFIENAFKHGVSYSNPSRVAISVQSDAKVFRFRVENTIHSGKPSPEGEGGLGIQNVARRLNLLFAPEEYDLQYKSDGNLFTVTLQIPVKYD